MIQRGFGKQLGSQSDFYAFPLSNFSTYKRRTAGKKTVWRL